MLTGSSRRRVAHAAVAAGLAGVLIGSFPASAFADTQSDLASAQTQLAEIGREYQQLQGSLQQAASDLETTKGEIVDTAEKLDEAQKTLSASTSVDYKTGAAKLGAVVLGATNFNDMISRVFYMNKLSEAQAKAIDEVKTLKQQLEEKQGEQEQRLKETQEQVDAAAANQKEAQALVSSLSSEVKAELEAKAAQDAALAAGLQSSDDASNAPAGGSVTGSQDIQDAVKDTAQDDSTGDKNSGGTENSNQQTEQKPASGKPSGGSSLPQNPSGSNPLAVALQYQGAPYVWGGSSPSQGGFDCSGLVYFSYLQCGITLPRTDSGQREYIKSHGFFTTDVSKLSYGDLVFFPGHVAFYVGNGQIYGARRPGVGASTTSMSGFGTFLGGGHL